MSAKKNKFLQWQWEKVVENLPTYFGDGTEVPTYDAFVANLDNSPERRRWLYQQLVANADMSGYPSYEDWAKGSDMDDAVIDERKFARESIGELGKFYKGDLGKLAASGTERIDALEANGEIDGVKADRLKNLITAYNSLKSVATGDLISYADIMDESGQFGSNPYVRRSINEASYRRELPTEEIGLTEMAFPDASRAAKMDDPWYSTAVKGLFDVLESPARAGIAGYKSLGGDEFTREMARPTKYTGGGEQVLKSIASPTGLLKKGTSAAGRGALSIASKYGKVPQGVISNMEKFGYIGKPADIIAGNIEPSMLKGATREMIAEAPLAALEGLREGSGQEGSGLVGGLTTLAGLGGAGLQGALKQVPLKFEPDSRFRTLADEEELKRQLKNRLAVATPEEMDKWGTSLQSTADVEKAINRLKEAEADLSTQRGAMAGELTYKPQEFFPSMTEEIGKKTSVADQTSALKELRDVTGVDVVTPFSEKSLREDILKHVIPEGTPEEKVLFEKYVTQLAKADTPKKRQIVLDNIGRKYGDETSDQVSKLLVEARTPMGRTGITYEDVKEFADGQTMGDFQKGLEDLGLAGKDIFGLPKSIEMSPLTMEDAIAQRTQLRQRAGIGQGEAVEATKQGAKSAHDVFVKAMKKELEQTDLGKQILEKYGEIAANKETQAGLQDLIKTANKADSQFNQMANAALARGQKGNVLNKFEQLQKDVNDNIRAVFPDHEDIDFITPTVMRKVATLKEFKATPMAQGLSDKAARAAWIAFREALMTSSGPKATMAILRKYLNESPSVGTEQEFDTDAEYIRMKGEKLKQLNNTEGFNTGRPSYDPEFEKLRRSLAGQ